MTTPTATRAADAFMFDPGAETMSRDALTRSSDRACAAHPAARLRQGPACPGQVRCRRRDARRRSSRSTTSGAFRSRLKTDMRDTYPFGLFAVPREQVVRLHASSGTTGKATVVGYTQARHRPLGRPDGALHGLRRRAAGRHRAQRLWLRPVHRRARRALRRRAARLHRRAGVRRHDRAAGHADAGFRRPRAVRDAVLCAQHCRGRRAAWASICRKLPLQRRHFRRRALERCAAPRARRAARHLRRSISTACRRSSAPASPANAAWRRDGLHGWEDHFLFEVIDPKTLEPVAPGEPGELVITTLTKEALPMIRYRIARHHAAQPRAVRLRPQPCPHHARDRPRRRHDDHPRRQRVSVAGRGGAGRHLPGVAPHYQIVLTREGALDAMTVEVETAPGAPNERRRPRPQGQGDRRPDQGAPRRELRGRHQGRRRGAALAGQGRARQGFAKDS